jgi:pimeloyl-ACP methyl ester carboxylesterase
VNRVNDDGQPYARLGPLTAPGPAPEGSPTSRIPVTVEHGLVSVSEGVRLHYTVAGEGEPVLLLPGWPQSWYAWRFVIPLLVAQGRKVYSVDTRGFGDSDAPSDGYDLATLAQDIHVFISRLGLAGERGVDIVSHDTGSWIAHSLAAAYPEDVRRLVVSDAFIPGVSPDPPAGYPDMAMVHRQWHFYFNRVEGLPEALIQGRERVFLSWFFGPAKLARTWTIEPEAFDEYLRVYTRPGVVSAGLAYYREVFSPSGRDASAIRSRIRLDMPILALGGELADADNLYTTMQSCADDVEGHVFAGVGHHLPEECPEDMVEAIARFWARDTMS